MHYVLLHFCAFIFYKNVSCIYTTESHDYLANNLMQDVYTLLDLLDWKCVTVIHDDDHVFKFPGPVQQLTYTIGNTGTNTTVLLEEIHRVMFPCLNIVILLQKGLLLNVVKQMNNIDVLLRRTTDYRHHAKLLILSHDASVLKFLETEASSLEHVVTLLLRTSEPDRTEVYTLHIHPHGREFSRLPDLKSLQTSTFVTTVLFPNTQYGYNNRCLVVSTLQSEPYVLKQRTGGVVTYDGYAWDIWTTIAQMLNLSFVVTEPPDGSWGVQDENGTWNGLVQQLIERDADLVIADLTVDYRRTQIIDYIYPSIKIDPTDIIYRKIPSFEKSFYRVAKPFTKNVYFVVMALFLWTMILYIVVENTWNIIKTVKGRGKSRCFGAKLQDIVTNFLGSALRQGFQQIAQPNTTPGRILLAFWCLFVLIETSLYSGNLVASFSADTDTNEISSIDQLVDSDYTVGAFTQSVGFATLQNSTRPELSRLYNKMVTLSQNDDAIFTADVEGQIRRVKEQQHAYVVYRSMGESLAQQDCMISMVGESITWAEERMSFGVIKGSPMKKDIDKIMLAIKESGLLDVWWKKWTFKVNTSTCNTARTVKIINLSDVWGIFMVVCGGIVLSLTALLTECVHKRHILEKNRNLLTHNTVKNNVGEL